MMDWIVGMASYLMLALVVGLIVIVVIGAVIAGDYGIAGFLAGVAILAAILAFSV